MPGTIASVAFIVTVGAGAAYMFQKDTVIRGTVMAADLLEQLAPHGINDVTCDDAPITPTGAVFICRVAAKDGSRATIEYTMDRSGARKPRQLGDSTYDRGPDPSAPRDPSADPWSQ